MLNNNFTPCESKPFMRLAEDNSNAPILDYNIPQKNCLPLYSIQEVNILRKYLKKQYSGDPPKDNFWEALEDKGTASMERLFMSELQNGDKNFIDNVSLIQKSSLPVIFYNRKVVDSSTIFEPKSGGVANLVALKGNAKEVTYEQVKQNVIQASDVKDINLKTIQQMQANATVSTKDIQKVKIPSNISIEFDLDEMVKKFSEGFKGMVVKKPNGVLEIQYYPRQPKDPIPKFYIKFEMSLCSFLGNYGAGDTVSTFSLLPGEKTTITVNTYKNSAYSRSRSENVLESISESSINSFESAVQNQQGSSSEISNQFSQLTPGVTVNAATSGLMDLLYGHADASYQSPTTSNASISHLSQISSSVSSALAQTVNESNYFRDVNVNTSSYQTEESGEDTSITREIENANLSRTLNFVFRRLLQKYISVLWLKNVKFGFTLGTPETTVEVYPQGLKEMINKFVAPQFAEHVTKILLRQVYHIFNHNQQPVQFLECIELNSPTGRCNCSNLDIAEESQCFWVKKRDVEDSYDNITVPGVIMNVSEHVLRTPSVIVDALLGQGEALDCYNSNLQQQNIITQQLKNEQQRQAIAIIDGFSSAEEKAQNYKLVFGECCKEEK